MFELFDAKGELRAICGGGRYDTLLQSLGGVDLPALGFGMGDVVLGELLRERGLLPSKRSRAPGVRWRQNQPAMERDVRRAATALRRSGVSVEYALREQRLMKQVKAAKSAGASCMSHAAAIRCGAQGDDSVAARHSWSAGRAPGMGAALTTIDL